jgi:hypothetical protein
MFQTLFDMVDWERKVLPAVTAAKFTKKTPDPMNFVNLGMATRPPAQPSDFTISSVIFLASPSSIIVLSR